MSILFLKSFLKKTKNGMVINLQADLYYNIYLNIEFFVFVEIKGKTRNSSLSDDYFFFIIWWSVIFIIYIYPAFYNFKFIKPLRTLI